MATVVLVLAGLILVGILLANANPPTNARHAGLDFPIYPDDKYFVVRGRFAG